MSNKTSDKNVGSIEDDVKRCNELIKVEHANWIGISNQLAISHILAEREQKDKRIKELEEENKRKDMFLEMAKEVIENSILKQVVKDKIEEYKKQQNKYENELQEPFAFNYFHREALKLAHKIQALQELLEGEK